MKNKLQKTMAIVLAMLLTSIAMLSPVKAYEIGEYAELNNYGAQQCMYWNGDYAGIEQLMYYDGNKNFPAYYYTYNGIPKYYGRKTMRQGEVTDDNLRKIVLAGYPYHSYSELGCTSEYPAYMATQLCILEYTQGEILSNYQGCNTQGYQVETAIQKIKENLANQYQIGETPIFSIVADTEWQDYPYDPNYIFKEMHIQCDTPNYPRAFTIKTEDTAIEILDGENYPSDVFYPNNTWKIRIPKTAKETGMEIAIKAETTNEMDNMWYASSTENGETFVITQDREETKSESYTETIEKPEPEEKPTPENPGGEENKGDNEENKEPVEDNKPTDKNEDTQKPEEKPTEDNSQTENKPNTNPKVEFVFQPNQTITNENQNNVTVQVQVNPEIVWNYLQQEKKENDFQNEQEETTQSTEIEQPKVVTSNRKVITASKITMKKLPRTGY